MYDRVAFHSLHISMIMPVVDITDNDVITTWWLQFSANAWRV